MMGLLDSLNSREGILGLSLLDAGAARPGGRTNLGAGLLQALSQADAFEQTQKQRKLAEEDRLMRQQMQELQMEQARAQLGETAAAAAQRQRQLEQAQRDESLIRQNFAPPQGPTPDGSPIQANRLDPRFMLGQGASLQGLQQAMQLDSALNPQAKPDDFKVVGGSLVRIKPDSSVAEAYRAPDKPDKPPSAVQEYEYAKGQGFKGSFADWELQKRRAGATSVSVNTGQKGFDNTLKLRGDFRSEPVYKAHQEMQSAHSQIQQALKQASPAGDLAGATKIMKLLDPGSVVRESELGMAMAASGLMDRIQNYAGNVMAGTKLTPTQRADFQRLADSLYAESVKQYNGKRSEYQGISERNGLNTEDVLGSPSAAPTTPGQWSIKRVP
jgi:hypothetical protein